MIENQRKAEKPRKGRKKRKQRDENDDCSELPTDIVEEILSRLPVKSLMRFRCVSQQWQNLFSDPDFVVKHMKKNPNPTHILEGKFDCLYSSKIESYITKITQRRGRRPELQSLEEWGSFPRGVRFQASCDGLVCLSLNTRSCNGSYKIGTWLYNPATREKLLLPQMEKNASTVESLSAYYGLGVNPITKEYKVVKITNMGREGIASSVMIYTVGDGSHRWKHASHVSFPYILGYPGKNTCVCVGGSVHWLATPRERCFLGHPHPYNNAWNVIVSFDPHREVVQEMPSLPFYQSDHLDMKLCLGHLGGCLSVCTSRFSLDSSVELWVMKEYGVRESWTNVFRMKSPELTKRSIPFLSSRGFLKDGGKILLMTSKTKPFLCNPETKETTKMKTSHAYCGYSYFDFFVSFAETLVSLKVGSSGPFPIREKRRKGKRQLKKQHNSRSPKLVHIGD